MFRRGRLQFTGRPLRFCSRVVLGATMMSAFNVGYIIDEGLLCIRDTPRW